MNHVSLLWTKTTFYALHVDIQTIVGMTRRWSPWAVLACLLPRKSNLVPQTTPSSSCSTIVYHNSGQPPGKLQLIMIYCCARHCRWIFNSCMLLEHCKCITTTQQDHNKCWDFLHGFSHHETHFYLYIMRFHTNCLSHSEVLRRRTIEDTAYVCVICVHMFQVYS